MSTETIMVFALSLLALLVSVPFVRSDQSTLPFKSFKINENVTYDCIDIYKQPGLDHPLLKNHTIQMKPSVSRYKTSINKTYTNGIGCPYGTVPILRNTKEYIFNAQLFSEKNVHPLTKAYPGIHIAAIRSRPGPYKAIEAWLEGFNLNVKKDQVSLTHVAMGSILNHQVNFVQAGFMIDPTAFGDGTLWSYVGWAGNDGIAKFCTNKPCPGFVQVSRDIPITKPFYPAPNQSAHLFYTIYQDKETGNWWVQRDLVNIGYWPKELFDLMRGGANIAQVAGVARAPTPMSSPPMGNGHLPTGGDNESAKFAIINIQNGTYDEINFPMETLMDSPNCYGLRPTKTQGLGHFFNYGGPGGSNCGV